MKTNNQKKRAILNKLVAAIKKFWSEVWWGWWLPNKVADSNIKESKQVRQWKKSQWMIDVHRLF